ncbi:MAG TPA: TetR/AcrR family transcriptional regulator [Pseudonocardia sp.]|jgi:AcrR family transcriptional regulator
MTPGARRDQLVHTALELFAEQPPELVTPEQVAQAADVSRALFYRYFTGVHELRVAALRTVVDEVKAAITPPPGGGLLDQVRYSLSAFLGSAQTYSRAYVALLRTGSLLATDETNELVDSVRQHVVRIVADRLASVAPPEAPDSARWPAPMFELTLRSWFAVVEGASVAWLREGVPARGRLEDWLVDQLVAMVTTTARHDPATATQLAAALRIPT